MISCHKFLISNCISTVNLTIIKSFFKVLKFFISIMLWVIFLFSLVTKQLFVLTILSLQLFKTAKIHCEIFLPDYFMKHSLMHISLHIIRFHKIYVKYVKRNHSRTIIRKCSICFEYVFSKNSTKQKTKRKRNVKVKPWLKNRRYTTTFNNIYMRSWWLMRLKNQYCFVSLFISCLIEQTGCLIQGFFLFPYSN